MIQCDDNIFPSTNWLNTYQSDLFNFLEKVVHLMLFTNKSDSESVENP